MGLFYEIAATEFDSQKATYHRVVQFLKRLMRTVYSKRRPFEPLRSSGVKQSSLMHGIKDTYEQFMDSPKTRRFEATQGWLTGGSTTIGSPGSPQNNPGSSNRQQASFFKCVQLMKHFNSGKWL